MIFLGQTCIPIKLPNKLEVQLVFCYTDAGLRHVTHTLTEAESR